MTKARTYPDHTLEKALRERGIQVRVLWEMKGPKNTLIDWLVGYAIAGQICIVETFKSGGWDAFTSGQSNLIDETVADVIARCVGEIGGAS
jgi:hypothetical protein